MHDALFLMVDTGQDDIEVQVIGTKFLVLRSSWSEQDEQRYIRAILVANSEQ